MALVIINGFVRNSAFALVVTSVTVSDQTVNGFDRDEDFKVVVK